MCNTNTAELLVIRPLQNKPKTSVFSFKNAFHKAFLSMPNYHILLYRVANKELF